MAMTVLTLFYVILTAGIVLMTAIACLAAKYTAIQNLVTSFQEQYSSRDMYNDLRALAEFERADKDEVKGDNILKRLVPLIERPGEENTDALAAAELYVKLDKRDVEYARRNLNFYFKRAYRLYQRGYLPLEDLQLIVNTNGKDLLFRVVQPLSMADHLVLVSAKDWKRFKKGYEKGWFNWFSELSKIADAELPPKSRTTNALGWLWHKIDMRGISPIPRTPTLS